jgi:hypothetical protein
MLAFYLLLAGKYCGRVSAVSTGMRLLLWAVAKKRLRIPFSPRHNFLLHIMYRVDHHIISQITIDIQNCIEDHDTIVRAINARKASKKQPACISDPAQHSICNQHKRKPSTLSRSPRPPQTEHAAWQ